MKIGLDIDNVLNDFDGKVLSEYKKFTNNKDLKYADIDWRSAELQEYLNNNMEQISLLLPMRRNTKYYMDKLLEDGHKLILITHRVYPHYNNPYEVTKEWLEKHKINYSELILSKHSNKSEECKENNIDIMVDDRVSQCEKMIADGINCYVMLTKYNKSKAKNMKKISSWKNLYEVISEWKK